MPDEIITVDVTNLTTFAKGLKRVRPDLNRELGRAMKAAGDIVALDAKARSAGLAGVPGSIKVRRRGLAVRVEAGVGESQPHVGKAHAFEHDGKGGNFRHPVFGHRDRWAPQAARPFLRPALAAKQNDVLRAVSRALDDVIDRL